MIRFQCAQCNTRMQVKDELAGKKGKCPTCGTVVTIPAASGDPATPCPGCGEALAAEVVVCLQCGYDRRTGQRIAPAAPAPVVRQVMRDDDYQSILSRIREWMGIHKGLTALGVLAVLGVLGMLGNSHLQSVRAEYKRETDECESRTMRVVETFLKMRKITYGAGGIWFSDQFFMAHVPQRLEFSCNFISTSTNKHGDVGLSPIARVVGYYQRGSGDIVFRCSVFDSRKDPNEVVSRPIKESEIPDTSKLVGEVVHVSEGSSRGEKSYLSINVDGKESLYFFHRQDGKLLEAFKADVRTVGGNLEAVYDNP